MQPPEHPTWHIQDSTKINTFKDCPRQYFYQYVLGWKKDEAARNDLTFGSAWHKAMERLLSDGYDEATQRQAMLDFMVEYRKVFDESTDAQFKKKNPMRAIQAIQIYSNKYAKLDENLKILYLETAGTVSIGGDRRITFKMDTIIEHPDFGIVTMDHKSATKIDHRWKSQWQLSFQMGTYIHAMNCLVEGRDDLWGAIINGAAFGTMKEFTFERIPIHKSKEAMQMWLWNANHYMDMIEWNFERMAEVQDDDPVMNAWPQQDGSCTKYFGCPFMDICSAWPNPLAKIEKSMPLDYKVNFWNPLAEHTKKVGAENVVEL